ncbi:helicase, partial [Muribaculaceae bacterium Isolate-001 (NCI)]
RHDRVAGLGNSEGSKRALNLLYAIRTIQERTGKDLGATFLSGTTISNSLTELYLLFKYLRTNALESQQINCFDAWAAIVAKKTTDFEFTVTNTIAAKERFRYFIKVPELAAFYNEITDYKTAEDVGVDRPEKNEIMCNIPPT